MTEQNFLKMHGRYCVDIKMRNKKNSLPIFYLWVSNGVGNGPGNEDGGEIFDDGGKIF